MKLDTVNFRDRAEHAYTIAEVVVSVFVLGVLVLSLFGAFSSGVAVVQLTREDMRATQILMQKMETIRLYNWSQLNNPGITTSNFPAWYDPSGTNVHGTGVFYRGLVTVSPAPLSVPNAYRQNVRRVTVTLYWTNYVSGSKKTIPRSRQMETYVARSGMQGYLY
jgi:type II secretory pathway pseudopilin PulG